METNTKKRREKERRNEKLETTKENRERWNGRYVPIG